MATRTVQEWEATVIEEVNTCKDRIIHPGPSRPCDQCRSDFDTDQQDEMNDEGGFSWRACELCDSTLGGNRYAAHGLAIDADAMAAQWG